MLKTCCSLDCNFLVVYFCTSDEHAILISGSLIGGNYTADMFYIERCTKGKTSTKQNEIVKTNTIKWLYRSLSRRIAA